MVVLGGSLLEIFFEISNLPENIKKIIFIPNENSDDKYSI